MKDDKVINVASLGEENDPITKLVHKSTIQPYFNNFKMHNICSRHAEGAAKVSIDSV